jgi:hypothetical protein
MQITGVLIDVLNMKPPHPYTIESTNLESYYTALGCDVFDITTRKIGQNFYDIYCDDEGLLKCNPVLSAVDSDGAPALVGNLFICKHDEEGNTIGLESHELQEIIASTRTVFDIRGQYKVLICDI